MHLLINDYRMTIDAYVTSTLYYKHAIEYTFPATR